MDCIILGKRETGSKIKDEGGIEREADEHAHFCIHSLEEHTRSGNDGCPKGVGQEWGLQPEEAFHHRPFCTDLIV